MAQKPLAIQNATIITGTGETIENGTVLFRDGKIQAVGKKVKVPVAARIIDATDHYVIPGMVEAHSSSGMSQANETNQIVPYVTVIDGIDPMNSYFRQARRNGITTVRISPGNSTMIGGQAAVIKTGGEFIDEMVVDGVAGIKISLRPVSGSRMAHLARLRKTLKDAKEKLEEKEEKEKKAEDKEKKDDDKKSAAKQDDDKKDEKKTEDKNKVSSPAALSELDKAMNALLSGKNSAIIYCEKAMDVGQALRLIKEFDLKASLVLGRDCHKAAKEIAASKLPVILDPTLVYWEEDPRTREEKKIVLPKIYRDAGVDFVFQTNRPGSSTIGSNYMWYQAATGVKYGMTEEEALAAVTSLPAKFLNVDKFVGTIEKGKDADVVILSGKPLDLNTWVETTIVGGEIVYEKEKDEQLKRLLTGEEKDSE
ncbi:MAG: amidohydrolase family protein [Planctomycetota bacterium]